MNLFSQQALVMAGSGVGPTLFGFERWQTGLPVVFGVALSTRAEVAVVKRAALLARSEVAAMRKQVRQSAVTAVTAPVIG